MVRTILAVIGGLWLIGRLSRRSPNHPLNAIPEIIHSEQPEPYPVAGAYQETAQIQGSLVLGEGGGE